MFFFIEKYCIKKTGKGNCGIQRKGWRPKQIPKLKKCLEAILASRDSKHQIITTLVDVSLINKREQSSYVGSILKTCESEVKIYSQHGWDISKMTDFYIFSIHLS